MITTNNYKYTQKGRIITLYIPKTQGIYTPEVQAAQREICSNWELNFSEIRIKKVPVTKKEMELIEKDLNEYKAK